MKMEAKENIGLEGYCLPDQKDGVGDMGTQWRTSKDIRKLVFADRRIA